MIYRCPYEKRKLIVEITYKRSFFNHIKYHFSVKELKFPLISKTKTTIINRYFCEISKIS